jgi:hypothetical protein
MNNFHFTFAQPKWNDSASSFQLIFLPFIGRKRQIDNSHLANSQLVCICAYFVAIDGRDIAIYKVSFIIREDPAARGMRLFGGSGPKGRPGLRSIHSATGETQRARGAEPQPRGEEEGRVD